jgi:hypothetical protein
MTSIQRKAPSDREGLSIYFDGERSVYGLRGEERTRAIAEAIQAIASLANNDADVSGNTGSKGGCPNYEYIKRVLMEMDAQRASVPHLTQEDIDKAFIYAFDHEMIGSENE